MGIKRFFSIIQKSWPYKEYKIINESKLRIINMTSRWDEIWFVEMISSRCNTWTFPFFILFYFLHTWKNKNKKVSFYYKKKGKRKKFAILKKKEWEGERKNKKKGRERKEIRGKKNDWKKRKQIKVKFLVCFGDLMFQTSRENHRDKIHL